MRVLLTVRTTSEGESHTLTIDTPLDGRLLSELHEFGRSLAEAAGILGAHTTAVGVDVSFDS
jgi:hypothetical protein